MEKEGGTIDKKSFPVNLTLIFTVIIFIITTTWVVASEKSKLDNRLDNVEGGITINDVMWEQQKDLNEAFIDDIRDSKISEAETRQDIKYIRETLQLLVEQNK